MSVFHKSFSQYLPSVAVGIGVALVAPIVAVAAVPLIRPLAKAALKGGFMVRDAEVGAYSLAESQMGKLTGRAEDKPAPKAKVKSPKSGPKNSVAEPTENSET